MVYARSVDLASSTGLGAAGTTISASCCCCAGSPMNQFASDRQPPPSSARSGRQGNEDWDAGPVPSRFRRRPGVTALAAFGVLAVVVAAVVGLAARCDDDAGSAIGGGITPPPCAEAGTREVVEPPSGSAFRFQMPQCFRSGEGLISPGPGRGDGRTRVVLLPVDLPLTAGEPVTAQITVSATDVGADAASDSDQEMEEQFRRGLGVAGAGVEAVRRDISGARGWGFRVNNPHRPLVAWAFAKGTMQITVICRWFADDIEARMLAGCNQVVDTLTIA